MDDLISRATAIDAFLTELTKRERKNLLHTWSTVEVKYFVVDMLEKLPSAQLMRKKGKWLPYKYAKPGHEYKFHVCSVCGCCDEYVSDVPRPNGTIGRLESVRNFCPNCGADMRGDPDE